MKIVTVFSIFLSISLLSISSFQIRFFSHLRSKSSDIYQGPLLISKPVVSVACEDGVDLSQLSNISSDSQYLQENIQDWLNKEYINLPIHRKIGLAVQEIYENNRRRGVRDLSELLLNTGTSLESMDLENAFVNAWDVANKVSDLLMLRMERELCSCAELILLPSSSKSQDENDIHSSPSIDNETFQSVLFKFSSMFQRYTFLLDIVEARCNWEEVRVAFALILGYRMDERSKKLVRRLELIPLGWEWITAPAIEQLKTSESLGQKMTEDLPDDSVTVESFMEQIAGMEEYRRQVKLENSDVLRRYLIITWFYVQGFLESDFPPNERFIPGHQREE